jgi:hypothetical protein
MIGLGVDDAFDAFDDEVFKRRALLAQSFKPH